MRKRKRPGWVPTAGTYTKEGIFSRKLLREVFLNPGLCLLFGGIVIGFVSGLQGNKVTHDADSLFISAFQGALCLFLLEMGMTAASKVRDLRAAGRGFIFFGLLAPNLFAPLGIIVSHAYAYVTRYPPRAGNIYPIRGALRRGVVHRSAGGAASGHPRGESDPAPGGVAGADLLLQRHHRDSALHRDFPPRRPLVRGS